MREDRPAPRRIWCWRLLNRAWLAAKVCIVLMLTLSLGVAGLAAQHGHGSEGVGKVHMDTSCTAAVQPAFDRALALLHNFWYARALTRFRA